MQMMVEPSRLGNAGRERERETADYFAASGKRVAGKLKDAN